MNELIFTRIQQLFPTETISIEGEGWFSCAFDVNDCIVRVSKDGTNIYQKELEMLSFLQDKISVKIPSISIFYNDELFYSIHKKIHGQKWDFNTYNNLTSKQKDLFCHDLALFLTELHKIPVSDALKRNSSLKQDNFLTNSEIHEMLMGEFSTKQITKVIEWVRDKEKGRKNFKRKTC